MRPVTMRRADLSDLISLGPKALCGETLKAIKTLEISIVTHGLLNPLIVKHSETGLIVVEGHKRLMAAKRLKAAGKLPRDLHTLPYVILGEHIEVYNAPMSLLSNRDQFMEVGRLHTQGHSVRDIANALDSPVRHIRDILSITKLSRHLQASFLCDLISIEQARAFATVPNKEAQNALMQALGPFAKEPDIISAIYSGETVLTIEDGNIIILPSRTPVEKTRMAA